MLNVAKFNRGNPKAQEFLRQSQCGFNGFGISVCCPETTLRAVQPWVQQNQNQQQNQNNRYEKVTQSNLPKHPECGTTVEDRIFGGTKTSIFEFPWFALLKYSKRKYFSVVLTVLKKKFNHSGIPGAYFFVQRLIDK